MDDGAVTQPLPFAPSQSGAEGLAGAQRVCHNFVVDSAGALRRRPGLELVPGLYQGQVDTAIDALHVTSGGDVIAVGARSAGSRSIYRVTASAAVDLSSGRAQGRLLGSGRPVIAETEAILAVTAGDRPVKLVLSNLIPSLLGGDPPMATHVAANSQRLVMNDPDQPGQVDYSDLASGSSFAGHESWSGVGDSGFIEAESRPDPVVAVAERTGELFVFGDTTLQVFAVDADSVYAAIITHEYGCAAAYGIIRLDSEFCWLDHLRRVIASDGRSVSELGVAVREILDDAQRVDDAYGYRVHVGSADSLVWLLPTAGRALSYQKGYGWSQWSTGYDLGRHIANAVALRGHELLVGTTGGYVARYAREATTDLGEPILCRVETGAQTRGSTKRKRCRRVDFVVERAKGSDPATSGQIHLEWQDDEGEWSEPETREIHAGDPNPVVDFYSLGVYRTRRWRLSFSGDADIVIAGANETYELLTM